MNTTSGKPKILFVALAQSTHTHAWLELLDNDEFDVTLFGIDCTVAPATFKYGSCSLVKSWPLLSTRYNLNFRHKYLFLKVLSSLLGKDISWLEERWLVRLIRKWKPDIIHTLGFEPASYVFNSVIEKYGLDKSVWVVTARGGPELALKRFLPESARHITEVLQRCNIFIADNKQNYDHALALGIAVHKIASLGVVPGTGGVDVSALAEMSKTKTSERKRIIVWPKAYECDASKALPVLEALRLCWDSIKPCEIHMMALMPEVRMWFLALPEEIQKSCHLHDRIPRSELLKLMAESRVVLIPSLIDGVPNCLYEAMATRSFPIVSPIETIKNVVDEDVNVLYARNLYPQEIAAALEGAMNDDDLVDSAAENNLTLVSKIANRDVIKLRVADFYRYLAKNKSEITSRSAIQ